MGAFGDELSRLRRGRGIMATDLRERVGPSLRALAGIDPVASQEEARLSALARNFGDVSTGGQAARAGGGWWASRRLSRRSRSDLVNFHWNGVAICW